jgi:hypothetical protein
MKRTLLLTLAIACLAPALALASPAGPGTTHRRSAAARSASEPLHVQLARAVFPREKWQSFLTEASAELTRQIADTGKGQIELAPGFADRLREQYEILAPYEEMLHYQARLLGSQYSKPELRRLLTFYRTPLGRKSVPFLHDLMASSLQRVALQVQNGLPGALAELRPLVHRLPSAEGKAQPGQDAQAGGPDDGSSSTEESGQGAGPPATDDKSL